MMLIGLARLGSDAVVRTTQDGSTLADLSLAFNYGRSGDDGKRPTQWVNAVLWGERAKKLSPYLTKGTQVMITCRDVHIEKFTRRDGVERHTLKATVDNVDLIPRAKEPNNETLVSAPAIPTALAHSAPAKDEEDDIPF